MASELLEYEDEEDANDNSVAGNKRQTPPVPINALEKKELGMVPPQAHSHSQFKAD